MIPCVVTVFLLDVTVTTDRNFISVNVYMMG